MTTQLKVQNLRHPSRFPKPSNEAGLKWLLSWFWPLGLMLQKYKLSLSSPYTWSLGFNFLHLRVKLICLEQRVLNKHVLSSFKSVFFPQVCKHARGLGWSTQHRHGTDTVWRWFHIDIRRTERVSGRRTVLRHAMAQKGAQNRPKRWSDLASGQAVPQCWTHKTHYVRGDFKVRANAMRYGCWNVYRCSIKGWFVSLHKHT